jgi:gag-polypeptide of LTR copia-type
MVNIQRPTMPLLPGRDNWSSWSTGYAVYLRAKGTYKLLTQDPPLNPSALQDGLSSDQVTAWIMYEEDLEKDQIGSQKVASNQHKAAKALQKEYDEWEWRKNTTVSDIYFGCNVDVQSLIGKCDKAKGMWDFLSQIYSSSEMATFYSELLKLEALSPANAKNVRYLVALLNKSEETLTDMGQAFPDSYYVHIFLKGLRAPYPSLARDIRRRDISTIKLDDCIAEVFAE